jgi:hypothetical protein
MERNTLVANPRATKVPDTRDLIRLHEKYTVTIFSDVFNRPHPIPKTKSGECIHKGAEYFYLWDLTDGKLYVLFYHQIQVSTLNPENDALRKEIQQLYYHYENQGIEMAPSYKTDLDAFLVNPSPSAYSVIQQARRDILGHVNFDSLPQCHQFYSYYNHYSNANVVLPKEFTPMEEAYNAFMKDGNIDALVSMGKKYSFASCVKKDKKDKKEEDLSGVDALHGLADVSGPEDVSGLADVAEPDALLESEDKSKNKDVLLKLKAAADKASAAAQKAKDHADAAETESKKTKGGGNEVSDVLRKALEITEEQATLAMDAAKEAKEAAKEAEAETHHIQAATIEELREAVEANEHAANAAAAALDASESVVRAMMAVARMKALVIPHEEGSARETVEAAAMAAEEQLQIANQIKADAILRVIYAEKQMDEAIRAAEHAEAQMGKALERAKTAESNYAKVMTAAEQNIDLIKQLKQEVEAASEEVRLTNEALAKAIQEKEQAQIKEQEARAAKEAAEKEVQKARQEADAATKMVSESRETIQAREERVIEELAVARKNTLEQTTASRKEVDAAKKRADAAAMAAEQEVQKAKADAAAMAKAMEEARQATTAAEEAMTQALQERDEMNKTMLQEKDRLTVKEEELLNAEKKLTSVITSSTETKNESDETIKRLRELNEQAEAARKEAQQTAESEAASARAAVMAAKAAEEEAKAAIAKAMEEAEAARAAAMKEAAAAREEAMKEAEAAMKEAEAAREEAKKQAEARATAMKEAEAAMEEVDKARAAAKAAEEARNAAEKRITEEAGVQLKDTIDELRRVRVDLEQAKQAEEAAKEAEAKSKSKFDIEVAQCKLSTDAANEALVLAKKALTQADARAKEAAWALDYEKSAYQHLMDEHKQSIEQLEEQIHILQREKDDLIKASQDTHSAEELNLVLTDIESQLSECREEKDALMAQITELQDTWLVLGDDGLPQDKYGIITFLKKIYTTGVQSDGIEHQRIRREIQKSANPAEVSAIYNDAREFIMALRLYPEPSEIEFVRHMQQLYYKFKKYRTKKEHQLVNQIVYYFYKTINRLAAKHNNEYIKQIMDPLPLPQSSRSLLLPPPPGPLLSDVMPPPPPDSPHSSTLSSLPVPPGPRLTPDSKGSLSPSPDSKGSPGPRGSPSPRGSLGNLRFTGQGRRGGGKSFCIVNWLMETDVLTFTEPITVDYLQHLLLLKYKQPIFIILIDQSGFIQPVKGARISQHTLCAVVYEAQIPSSGLTF